MDNSVSASDFSAEVGGDKSPPKISWDDLGEILKRDGHHWTYIPNPGNAGDSLIAESTYQFFDRIGLSYSIASFRDTLESGARILIGGGGNLVPMYRNIRNFLGRNLEAIGSAVVLPHTIRGSEDLLGRLDQRFTLICRERPSYEFCLEMAPGAKVLLGDDMALQWRWERTRAALRDQSARTTDRQFLVRNLKHLTRRAVHRWKIHNGTLEAFRGDIEGKNRQHSRRNVDLSQVFSTDEETRLYAAAAVNSLASFIDRAERVHTDRLHIGVMSAILGKDVTMFDNSYGKNRAVFENSLAPRFPNVRLVD